MLLGQCMTLWLSQGCYITQKCVVTGNMTLWLSQGCYITKKCVVTGNITLWLSQGCYITKQGSIRLNSFTKTFHFAHKGILSIYALSYCRSDAVSEHGAAEPADGLHDEQTHQPGGPGQGVLSHSRVRGPRRRHGECMVQ